MQFIWKRVDFIEFDKQWWPQPDHNLAENKILLNFNSSPPVSRKKTIPAEGKGFLYCAYKCTEEESKKKLTLIKKKQLLSVSGRSRAKTIKALNALSKTLNCSEELKKISRILELYWKVTIKTKSDV